MTTELDKLIQKTWRARLDRRLEDVFHLKAQLSRFSSQARIKAELTLLEASLLRARGEIKASKEVIEAQRQSFVDSGQDYPARWCMEAGLNYFFCEEFSEACDFFLKVASSSDAEPELKVQGRLNARLCFEYLDVPSPNLEKLLEKDFLGSSTWSEGLARQWGALKMRRQFFLGQFPKEVSAGDDQLAYQSRWIMALPFVRNLKSELPDFENGYLRSFRGRTLLGLHSAADGDVNKTTDLIDRLYLWSWRKLAAQESDWSSTHELFVLILDRWSKPIPIASRHLLRLSLEWRAMFDPKFSVPNEVRLKATRDSAPFLCHAEYQVVDWFRSQLTGSTVTEPSGSLPEAMIKFLRPNLSRWKQAKTRDEEARVLVDLELMKISIKESGRSLHSEVLTRALHHLSIEPTTTCAQVLEKAYGQRGYDPHLHSGRLFNLLARLRDLLPKDFTLTKKQDFILFSGPIESIRPCIARAPHFRNSSERIPPTNTGTLSILSDLGQGEFSRRDLELRFKKSRASANRLIDVWKKSGWVNAIGSGRSKKYKVCEPWRSL
jgi:hypothetical protein